MIMIVLQAQKHIWKQTEEYDRIIILSMVRINGVKRLQLKMDQKLAKLRVWDWGNGD